MEAKRELKLDCLEDFDGRSKAALMPKNRENTITVLRPARTWNSSRLTQLGDNKDQAESSIRKISSSCIKTGSPRGNSIRKTKSLSAQFLVNIDELINNVTSAFDESDTVFSRTLSNELFSLTGSSLHPSDEISDVMRLQKPCHVKGKKHPIAEKSIVDGVTGSVNPGEVLAVMGPSGGGKTTLLNLLSGRVKLNSGTITYNQQPYNQSLKQRCQVTTIGGSFVKGISGGERKRLCIGNEILLNPSLLFLDEILLNPSLLFLDSTTALRIVQVLHSIAEAGKTIHQPSSRLFSKFDKLILLGKGSSLYSGKASEAMVYFSSIGCSLLIAMNPAKFLIDLANGNMKDKSVTSELEDKFLAGSQKIEAKDGRPSPVDVQVHEVYNQYSIEVIIVQLFSALERVCPIIFGASTKSQTPPFDT
ncbi:hypothetical protein TEA_009037 [Camellia sinensis var. sinensis]|uniref:ABC transporter domain-containing protein n=1 Tax=Camellia sinensis var. sinensis TaxID=542762 RepID=A0A4S4EWD2_CAMSN|nr:hypothetical protein TEA_009037 [Camellia sinensis var. sinensis]